jgi:hypothetical protein
MGGKHAKWLDKGYVWDTHTKHEILTKVIWEVNIPNTRTKCYRLYVGYA